MSTPIENNRAGYVEMKEKEYKWFFDKVLGWYFFLLKSQFTLYNVL